MVVDAASIDLLVKVTQLIGIPVAIVIYGRNKRKERIDREYGTYHALDEKYLEYLKLCLAHPDLDVSDTPQAKARVLSDEQRHRELVMFCILVSIMERAYLMYRDKSDDIRRRQWAGWQTYIFDWCRRPNFAAALPLIATQFDDDFCAYLRLQTND